MERDEEKLVSNALDIQLADTYINEPLIGMIKASVPHPLEDALRKEYIQAAQDIIPGYLSMYDAWIESRRYVVYPVLPDDVKGRKIAWLLYAWKAESWVLRDKIKEESVLTGALEEVVAMFIMGSRKDAIQLAIEADAELSAWTDHYKLCPFESPCNRRKHAGQVNFMVNVDELFTKGQRSLMRLTYNMVGGTWMWSDENYLTGQASFGQLTREFDHSLRQAIQRG